MHFGYLIKKITCPDPDVKAALSAVKIDDSLNGLRHSITFACASSWQEEKGKRTIGNISSAAVTASIYGGRKMDLVLPVSEEFANLSKAQHSDLHDWCSEKKEGNPILE